MSEILFVEWDALTEAAFGDLYNEHLRHFDLQPAQTPELISLQLKRIRAARANFIYGVKKILEQKTAPVIDPEMQAAFEKMRLSVGGIPSCAPTLKKKVDSAL